MSTKYKTFKEYYEDPDFREKHLKNMNRKVKCECGCKTTKGNLPRHKKTTLHANKMDEKNNELEQLRKEVKLLKKKLNK
jgi:hypothetical protein